MIDPAELGTAAQVLSVRYARLHRPGGYAPALSLINDLVERFGAVVVPGHDARTRERCPALDGPAGDVAVVLG